MRCPSRRGCHISWSKYIVVAVIFLAAGSVVGDAQAPGPVECSELEVVFEDDSGIAGVKPAAIVTDLSGAAHLLWLYKQDRDDRSTWAISYAGWKEGVWSQPNDVLITPGGGAGAPRVAAGEDGRLHVIWADGDLWYASSPAQSAGDARSWTSPVLLAPGVIDADVAIDGAGRLHVVFVTGQPTGPIYYMYSLEGGGWSTPRVVYRDSPRDATSVTPCLTVDGRGRVHVTWTENQLPGGWPPLGQWYARSEDGGEAWTILQLGVGEQGQGTVLAVGDDEIHLVWRGTTGAGNTYHQWSDGGGRTWDGPTVFDPDGGFSGRQSLAADSAGNVHLVRGDGGYQVWRGGQWSPVPAMFADSGETGTLAIGLGNQVHWVNTTPSSSEKAIVWHRLCQSDSPSVASLPLPEPRPTQTLSTPVVEPTGSPTLVSNPLPLSDKPAVEQSAGMPILVAVLPVIVLLLAILLVRGIHPGFRGD